MTAIVTIVSILGKIIIGVLIAMAAALVFNVHGGDGAMAGDLPKVSCSLRDCVFMIF